MYQMNRKWLTDWLAALRSGEYKQTKGTLFRPAEDGFSAGYCCLGVMQCVIDGDVEYTDFGTRKVFPSEQWVYEKNLQNLRPLFDSLAQHNDEGRSFADIADRIEKEIVPVD